jgi:glycosyltransferase involved in cell wall biosynthesis
MNEKKRKIIICIPTVTRPYQECLDSLEASIPLIQAAGWDEGMANSIGCPYISYARAHMLRKAMDTHADVIVFIDHDLSWKPQDLLTLIETEGDVVAGTYRFKTDEKEEYMGALLPGIDEHPQVRADGCVKAHCIPAGFLKLTRNAISRFMLMYPELQYIDKGTLTVDLFNHGVHKGVWYGEDYSFSRNWIEKCGDIWIIPDLDLTHHNKYVEKGEVIHQAFVGNFHNYLRRQPGGDLDGV